jgi:hypothetical protein
MELPSHPESGEPEPGPGGADRAGGPADPGPGRLAGKVVVFVLVALVALMLVLHLSGIVGPGAH